MKLSKSYQASAFGTSSPTHPHAYSDIAIQNGQVQSKTCIKKQPGSNYYFKLSERLFFSDPTGYIIF